MKIGIYSFPEGKEPKDLINEIKRLKHDVGNLGYKIKNQRHEINNRLKEIDKLQKLLGKCYRFLRLTETKVEAIEKVKRGLVKEIDEVLK